MTATTTDETSTTTCWCCGEASTELVSLGCHPEVAICPRCLDWLNTQRREQAAASETTPSPPAAAPRGEPANVTTSLDEITPIFPVRNVAIAIEHYRRLGFDAHAFEEGDDPIYGFADRDGVSIHLARVEDVDPSTSNSAAYLYVGDADALARAWRAADVGGTVHDPTDTEYGLREGAHVDPDGNLIRFGSPLH
jgi:catechol 2,3-dioxygenase-like lactoylglutathione lyase family enzyme